VNAGGAAVNSGSGLLGTPLCDDELIRKIGPDSDARVQSAVHSNHFVKLVWVIHASKDLARRREKSKV
jgi:hypothetical protein